MSMHWEVVLAGEVADLRMLTEVFRDSGLCISEREGTEFVISADAWNALDSAQEVRAGAMETASWLSGSARLTLGTTRSIEAGGVYKVRDDGSRDVFIFVESGEIRWRGFPATIRVGEEVRYPAEPVKEHIAVAAKTAAVARALRLRAVDRPDWVELYRMFEIVEHDMGSGIWQRGWAAKAEVDRFTHTANSPAAGDGSRHGVQKKAPPKNPMTLEEASAIVDKILRSWIESKAGGRVEAS